MCVVWGGKPKFYNLHRIQTRRETSWFDWKLLTRDQFLIKRAFLCSFGVSTRITACDAHVCGDCDSYFSCPNNVALIM